MIATSVPGIRARVGAFADGRPSGEWLLQGNWDETKLEPGRRCRTREILDCVNGGGDHPRPPSGVYEGPMLIENFARAGHSLAAAAARPTDGAGIIVRDAEGQPTGALKDRCHPLPSASFLRPRLSSAGRSLVTGAAGGCVHGCHQRSACRSNTRPSAALADLLAAGKLSVRVLCRSVIATVKIRRGAHGPRLRWAVTADRGRQTFPTARWARERRLFEAL